MQSYQIVEYIWIDSNNTVRSKIKIFYENQIKTVKDAPVWNFDGSSTG